MKKLFIPFLGVVLAMTTSCSGAQKSEAATTDTVAAETTDAQGDEADPVIELAEGAHIPASDNPVIIDFNATWCGPCQAFKPNYHNVARKYADRATFYSVDVDNHGELAAHYNVTSIPTVIILKADGSVSRHTGYMEEPSFEGIVMKAVE